jgi:hypothetical protein
LESESAWVRASVWASILESRLALGSAWVQVSVWASGSAWVRVSVWESARVQVSVWESILESRLAFGSARVQALGSASTVVLGMGWAPRASQSDLAPASLSVSVRVLESVWDYWLGSGFQVSQPWVSLHRSPRRM